MKLTTKFLCLLVIPSLFFGLSARADDKTNNANKILSDLENMKHDANIAIIKNMRAAPPPPKGPPVGNKPSHRK